jgi:hypothetical protein
MSSVLAREHVAPDAVVIESVRLPLENIEFTIEQFLLAHGSRLDTETRCLLAGVRDGVRRVASKARDAGEDHVSF